MTVLHLLKTSVGARWALLQLRELVRAGVTCHVVLPSADGQSSQYEAAGIRVHVLDLNVVPGTGAFFRAARELATLVRQVRPEVVHSHFVATTLVMRLALRGEKTVRVFQVPGPLHLENPLLARFEVGTAGSNDYWIASCEWTERRYRELGVAPERVFLAHYGSDLDECVPAEKGMLRRELGLPSGTSVVGMVAYCYKPKRYLGRTRGIKGHEDFIDAVGLLRRDGRDVVGVIAGGAWHGADRYYARVQEYARANPDPRVLFLGTRKDIRNVYADLDVAVHPSLSENLGGAAESLLLAVPTVTTSVGGFPDLIEDGLTGRMVPPRDPRRLAVAIRDLLDAPLAARTMADRGQERARQLLDVRRTSAKVSSIYQEILSATHSANRASLETFAT